MKFGSISSNKADKQLLKKQLLFKLLLTRNKLWPASTEYKPQLDQKIFY